MKKACKHFLAVLLLCSFSASHAQLKSNEVTTANTLFADNGCAGCHDFTNQLVGPALQQVAQRYKGKKATAKIADVIRLGGQGKWGDVPHPANEGIEKQNATLLAKWILSGAPQN